MAPRRTTVRRRQRPEDGATAVEYALMVTFIALAISVAVVIIGTNLSSIFLDAGTRI